MRWISQVWNHRVSASLGTLFVGTLLGTLVMLLFNLNFVFFQLRFATPLGYPVHTFSWFSLGFQTLSEGGVKMIFMSVVFTGILAPLTSVKSRWWFIAKGMLWGWTLIVLLGMPGFF